MIPFKFLYDEYIDRPKVSEQKKPFEYIDPPPQLESEQLPIKHLFLTSLLLKIVYLVCLSILSEINIHICCSAAGLCGCVTFILKFHYYATKILLPKFINLKNPLRAEISKKPQKSDSLILLITIL